MYLFIPTTLKIKAHNKVFTFSNGINDDGTDSPYYTNDGKRKEN